MTNHSSSQNEVNIKNPLGQYDLRMLLIRHGQSEGNVAKQFLGKTDSPLTANGRQQAENLAEHLKSTQIDAIYSSELQRASQTAGAIARSKGLNVVEEPRLNELNFGAWDGQPVIEMAAQYPSLFEKRKISGPEFSPPNGESLERLTHRVGSFMDELKSTYNNAETLVLVGHAGCFMAALCHLFQINSRPIWPFRLANGSITEIQFPHGLPVITQLSVMPPSSNSC